MINRIVPMLMAWALMLWTGIAFAADSTPVEVTLRAFQVSPALGGKLVPTLEARPGDVIEYQVTYRNPAREAAKQVAATLPVPDGGMAYLDGSASPGALQASLDGVHFAPTPLKREVTREGKRVRETVPPSEYKFLRWNLGDLAAGQQVTVKARMHLAAINDKQS
jgi:uncharacterized repeat protein (TIGR01451 family)